MFQRLPREYESDDIESVALDPSKMFIRFLQWKRCSYKTYIVRIKESLPYMRWNMGNGGILSIAPEVDSPQRHNPDGLEPFYGERKGTFLEHP